LVRLVKVMMVVIQQTPVIFVLAVAVAVRER
jgi:hypothetical protein